MRNHSYTKKQGFETKRRRSVRCKGTILHFSRGARDFIADFIESKFYGID